MPQLKALRDSAAKPSSGQFKDVGGKPISSGTVVQGAILKRLDNHYILDGSYYFAPHFERDKNPIKTVLSLSCHLQRNNRLVPSAACAHTSLIMGLRYLGIQDIDPSKEWQLEDEFYELMLANGVKRGYHDDIARLVNKRFPRIRARFSTEVSYRDLRTHLANGNPAYISGNFTRSGHIVAVRGYDEQAKSWLVHDPWGDYQTGYKNHNGCNLSYSYDLINKISYGKSASTWAMLLSKRD